MGILMLRSSSFYDAPGDGEGALRILPGSAADYGYARLDALPEGFGDAEFTLELWVKATTGLTVASTASTKTSRWSSDNVTAYSASDWWYLGNFLLDGHNNNSAEAGTCSLQIVNSGRVRWTFGDGAAAGARTGDLHAVTSTTSVIDGEWHSIHLVRRNDGGSGSELEIWIDGILEDMETSTARTNMASTYWDSWSGFPSNQDNWMFGAEKQAALGVISEWEHYMGVVDQIRFYNRAASTSEIGARNIASGLVGSYDFGEGTGTSVADSEGGASMTLVDADQYEWVTDDNAPQDLVPASFSFTDQTSVSLSSTITSAGVAITGIDGLVVFTASGGTIDVDSDGTFAASRVVTSGQSIRARHTSSGSNSTAVNTVVSAAGVSDTFTSTTEAEEGDLTHGASATVSSGFSGLVTPLWWDPGTPGSDTMDDVGYVYPYPNASGGDYDMAYRTPAEDPAAVALPHSSMTHYMSGAHYPGTGANTGYDVIFGVDYTYQEDSVYYISWLTRNAPGWTANIGTPNDNNYKYFYLNDGAGFAEQYGIHLQFSSGMAPNQNGYGSWNNQGAGSFSNPDNNGNNAFWNGMPSGANLEDGWRRHEVWFRSDSQSTGYLYEVINNAASSEFNKDPSGTGNKLSSIVRGKLIVAYEGVTETPGTAVGNPARSMSFGGYGRNFSTANRRYFANPYIQRGYGRVVLGNHATYSSATILVPQPATSSTTYTVYKGQLSSGTVYEYAFDSTNALVQTTARTMT